MRSSWAAFTLVGCLGLLGCSGLVGPDESRLDPANAPTDGGRRDLGRDSGPRPDGGPDGGNPDGGDGECVGDGDCNDGVDCTTDSCVDGFCQFSPDDTACSGDDPSPCVARVICDRAMGCQGVPLECDDGISCTDDRCEIAAGGCVYSDRCPDGETCDPMLGCSGGGCRNDEDCRDTDACTEDRCVGGMCQRPSRVCPDVGNPCQSVACNPGTGDCDSIDVADGTPCPDDGNLCTTGEACLDGTCQARGAIACSDPDGSPCTTSICDPSTGTCASSPVAAGTPCDDGNPCTDATVCDAMGGCGGGVGCPDDGNPCTDQHCTPSGCIIESSPDDTACPTSSGTTGGSCCAGNCTDLDVDSANCGACGSSCGDALCIGGTCAECENNGDCAAPGSCIMPNCNGGFCEFDLRDGFCFIAGTCIAAGTLNPTNQCQECNPARSLENWSGRGGATCDDGRWCTRDSTVPDPDNAGLDRCTNDGRCFGAARSCGDDNRCTNDSCNEDANRCENMNRTGPCTAPGGVPGMCCPPATGTGAAMCLPAAGGVCVP